MARNVTMDSFLHFSVLDEKKKKRIMSPVNGKKVVHFIMEQFLSGVFCVRLVELTSIDFEMAAPCISLKVKAFLSIHRLKSHLICCFCHQTNQKHRIYNSATGDIWIGVGRLIPCVAVCTQSTRTKLNRSIAVKVMRKHQMVCDIFSPGGTRSGAATLQTERRSHFFFTYICNALNEQRSRAW